MFIVVDGPNGAGKTTLIKNLASKGYSTLSSPAGTPMAQVLRPICRGTAPWEDVDPLIQFLCFSAARMDEYLRCVHNKKDIVVADRWWTSTFVYQCILQGFSTKFLEFTVHPEEKINMVILLDAQNEILSSRVEEERKKNPSHGICSWTKEKDMMFRLAEIYRKKLPPYLTKRGIPYDIIDTSQLTTNDVLEEIENHISDLKTYPNN
jgi:thymidylate kinase